MKVDKEIKLQERVLDVLKKDLGYRYIGNLKCYDNKSIKEDDFTRNLEKRGYSSHLVKLCLKKVKDVAFNQTSSLYRNNMEFYSILRYGVQGLQDEN